MRKFKSLHNYLQHFADLHQVDPIKYLGPFMEVVSSIHTSGPMTGQALASINKFLLYGFITSTSPRAKEAINQIAVAISGCRFEATDAENDEVVLMKLLEVVMHCLSCPAGPLLYSANVWSLAQTCFKLSRQTQSSALLRNTAENTLTHVVLTVFNLGGDEGSFLPEPSSSAAAAAAAPRKPDADTAGEEWGGQVEEEKSELPFDDQGGAVIIAKPPTNMKSVANGGVSDRGASPTTTEGDTSGEVLDMFLKFLIKLVDPVRGMPEDQREKLIPDVILGLSLINTVLETATNSLASHPHLVIMMQDQLCKYLLQNSQTNELQVLMLTLRVVFNLFNSIKDHLKVQLEVFFTSVHLRIASSEPPLFPSEQRELALESLLEFCREPALMVDLYINYDCDPQCTNLFETLCLSLTKNATPYGEIIGAVGGKPLETAVVNANLGGPDGGSPTLNILHVLALEALLSIVHSIASRCHLSTDGAKSTAGTGSSASASSSTNEGADGASAAAEDAIPMPPHHHSKKIGYAYVGLDSLPGSSNDSEDSTDASARLGVMTGASKAQALHSYLEQGGTSSAGYDGLTSLSEPSSPSGMGSGGSLGVEIEKRPKYSRSKSITSDANSFLSEISKDDTPRVSGGSDTPTSMSGAESPGFSASDSESDDETGKSAQRLQSYHRGASSEDMEWLQNARERTAEALQRRKKTKQRMLLAAERFNETKVSKPHLWIAYAQELELIEKPETPVSVAAFCRSTPGLDRIKLGDYLAMGPPEDYPFITSVLAAYSGLFDFKGKMLDAGLRKFLERFRLPGEAQKIDRLMESFAVHFHLQNSDTIFASSDTAFILSFSIIMLNTDLHNKGIKEEMKMTKDGFVRNNRGINTVDGKPQDMPREYLEALYDRIKDKEIQMMQDIGSGGAASAKDTATLWDGVLKRMEAVTRPSFTPVSTARKVVFRAGTHERDMSSILHEQCNAVTAISTVFDLTTDDAVVHKCIQGFIDFARIFVYFDMTEVFNHLLITLSKYFTRFAKESLLQLAAGTGANGRDHAGALLAQAVDFSGNGDSAAAGENGETAAAGEEGAMGVGAAEGAAGAAATGQLAGPPAADGQQGLAAVAGIDPNAAGGGGAGAGDAPHDDGGAQPQQPQPKNGWADTRIRPASSLGKALLTLQTVVMLSRRYGKCLREGWRNLLENILLLHRLHSLPRTMTALYQPSEFASRSGSVHATVGGKPLGPSKLQAYVEREDENSINGAPSGGDAAEGGEASGGFFSFLGFGSSSAVDHRQQHHRQILLGVLRRAVNEYHLEGVFTSFTSFDLAASTPGPASAASSLSLAPAASAATDGHPLVPLCRGLVYAALYSDSVTGVGSSGDIVSAGGGEGGDAGGNASGDNTQYHKLQREKCAVLALELTMNVVLAHRDHVNHLWGVMHAFFVKALTSQLQPGSTAAGAAMAAPMGGSSPNSSLEEELVFVEQDGAAGGGSGSGGARPMPFLVERVVVSILRLCSAILSKETMVRASTHQAAVAQQRALKKQQQKGKTVTIVETTTGGVGKGVDEGEWETGKEGELASQQRHQQHTNRIFSTLLLLRQLPSIPCARTEAVAERLAAGVLELIVVNVGYLTRQGRSRWVVIFGLLQRCMLLPKGPKQVWEVVDFLMKGHVTPHNFTLCLRLLLSYISSPPPSGNQQPDPYSDLLSLLDDMDEGLLSQGSAQAKATAPPGTPRAERDSRGKELAQALVQNQRDVPPATAVKTIAQLLPSLVSMWGTVTSGQPKASDSSSSSQHSGENASRPTLAVPKKTAGATEGGESPAAVGVGPEEAWLLLLRTFTHLLDDPRSEVSSSAWNSLQTLLPLPTIHISSEGWTRCFGEVLFPLIGGTGTAGKGSEAHIEQYLRACSLLSRTFLHNLPTLVKMEVCSSSFSRSFAVAPSVNL
jgi:hypothetical protein